MKTRTKLAMIGLLALSFLLIPLTSNSISYASEPVTASVCISINTDNGEIRDSLAPSSDTLLQTTEGQIFEVVTRFKDTLGVQLANNQIGYLPVSDTTPFVPIIVLGPDWVSNTRLSALSLPKSGLTEHNLFDLSAPLTSVATFKVEKEEAPSSEIPVMPQPQEAEEPEVASTQSPELPEKVEKKTPAEAPKPEPKPDPTPEPVSEPVIEPVAEPVVEPIVEEKPVSDSLSYLSTTEKAMFHLVNQVRHENGLQALLLDTRLVDLARLKSQDIINLDYFSHISPTYGSPIDMLKRYDIDYRGMGENLAGNQSVEKAHAALINSPGHLANILNPDFTHMGIGIRTGGKYENIYTQLFIGKP
ncbi:hypothetical protein JR334_05580 [Clostridia bacterium]|nr:hypothetical protein JR334_05580 [Clostridia bacterium]